MADEPVVPLLILGTRPYAEVLIDLFEGDPAIRFVGGVENRDRHRCGERLMGLPILWHSDIAPMATDHRLVCALGTTLRRDWIASAMALGFRFHTLVHASAIVSARTVLGSGGIVDAGVVIAGFSRLADHVRVGRRSSIGHHTQIGPYSTIHPGCIVSGNCRIGEQVTLGAGTVVIDGVEIGDGAVTSAGTVVTRNLPPGALMAGNPGRIIKADYGPI